jgi:hypothetical protein
MQYPRKDVGRHLYLERGENLRTCTVQQHTSPIGGRAFFLNKVSICTPWNLVNGRFRPSTFLTRALKSQPLLLHTVLYLDPDVAQGHDAAGCFVRSAVNRY